MLMGIVNFQLQLYRTTNACWLYYREVGDHKNYYRIPPMLSVNVQTEFQADSKQDSNLMAIDAISHQTKNILLSKFKRLIISNMILYISCFSSVQFFVCFMFM